MHPNTKQIFASVKARKMGFFWNGKLRFSRNWIWSPIPQSVAFTQLCFCSSHQLLPYTSTHILKNKAYWYWEIRVLVVAVYYLYLSKYYSPADEIIAFCIHCASSGHIIGLWACQYKAYFILWLVGEPHYICVSLLIFFALIRYSLIGSGTENRKHKQLVIPQAHTKRSHMEVD